MDRSAYDFEAINCPRLLCTDPRMTWSLVQRTSDIDTDVRVYRERTFPYEIFARTHWAYPAALGVGDVAEQRTGAGDRVLIFGAECV
jgi:hypothetical protein